MINPRKEETPAHENQTRQLFETIEAHARKESWSQAELAAQLGISYPYYVALRTGDKSLAKASMELIRRIGQVLGIPPVQILLNCGALEWSDFEGEGDGGSKLSEVLDQHYAQMQADRRFKALAPTTKDWASMPIGSRLSLVALYSIVHRQALRSAMSAQPWARLVGEVVGRR